MPLTVEEKQEIASLFVGQMVPLMEERETERKANEGAFRAEIQASIEKVNADIREIEIKGQRPTASAGSRKRRGDSAEVAEQKRMAFESYVTQGFFGMSREERDLLSGAKDSEDLEQIERKIQTIRAESKAFSIADDTLGGVFVLPEIVTNEVIKNAVLTSPVRSMARVKTTSAKEVQINARTGTLAAQWVSETGTRSETTGNTYGRHTINTFEMYAFVLLSNQLMDDEYFSLEQDLLEDIGEQFGVAEGAAFVNGTGSGQPTGFLANIVTNTSTSTGATAVTYAELVTLFHKLKQPYRESRNTRWAFNATTLGYIRSLVDDDHRPLWRFDGVADSNPATFLGIPYTEVPDMPSLDASAATKRCIAVGDFDRAYRFVDRVQMTIQRLNELYAATGQTGFLVHKRVGGKLVLEEALAVMIQHS